MSAPAQPADSAASHSAQVEDAVAALEAALEAEVQALTAQHADALLAAVADKRRALQALERLLTPSVLYAVAQRESDATASGAVGDDVTRALVARLQRCRELNEATGSAIASARHVNELALALLGHGGSAVTYGAKGRAGSNTPGPGRQLGQA